MTETEITATMTVKISLDTLAGILCNALEGGSNYWYTIAEFVEPTEIPEELREDWGDYRHLSWPLSPGGALLINTDRVGPINEDDPEGKTYRLDLDAIRKGVDVMARDYPRHFGDMVNGNDDADTGDCLLQCSLFGEEIFG